MGSARVELHGLRTVVFRTFLHTVWQVMEGIVKAYINLWAKQRIGVHAALASLLSALASKAAALVDMLQRLVTVLLAATLADSDPDPALGASCLLPHEPSRFDKLL